MNSLAVVLIISSCVVHAGWNLVAKRSRTDASFFLLASTFMLATLAPAFVWLGGAEILAAPTGLWVCLAITGVFQAGYFACLAAAYRHGDISIAYPLVRTTPVFVLLLAGLFLSQIPTWPAVAGILLAVAGCFLLPFRKLGLGPEAFEWKTYVNRTSLWALGAALSSTGYTLTDKLGMEFMTQVAPGPRGAFLYNYLEGTTTSAGLLAVALLFDRPAGLAAAGRTEKLRALLVGVLSFGAYTLILWAYANAEKVAYVAGLRQLSIVLGVIGGVVFFKERGGLVRVVASAIIVIGLVLIALAK